MARGHKCTCYVCGARYEYCESCVIVKPNYNANRFCSHEHQDIFAIISKNCCHQLTTAETLAALESYDTANVVGDIAKHIESLKEETKREVEHDEPTQE